MVLFCLMQEGSIWIRLELYHDSRLLVIWHRLLGPTWCNIALAIWAELWSQAASYAALSKACRLLLTRAAVPI
jgi:hypothetical protein